MNKIEKVYPVTPEVVSNRVIVSNKVLKQLVTSLNEVIVATNILIDKVEGLDSKTTNLTTEIDTTKSSVKALAAAMQDLQNIQ